METADFIQGVRFTLSFMRESARIQYDDCPLELDELLMVLRKEADAAYINRMSLPLPSETNEK